MKWRKPNKRSNFSTFCCWDCEKNFVLLCFLMTFDGHLHLTFCSTCRLHHWHHDKWPLASVCFVWGRSCITVCLQARYDHHSSSGRQKARQTAVWRLFLIWQIPTVLLKVEYRSWTVWPSCGPNQRPSSALSSIPAAWKVGFCLSSKVHVPGFSFEWTELTNFSNRKGEDCRRGEHRTIRWIHKSLVWKPSWGKKYIYGFHNNRCSRHSSLPRFSSLPPSFLTRSTSWISTSSSVWNRLTVMSRTVKSLGTSCTV